MEFKRHGLFVGMKRIEEEFFLFFKAQGMLTHKDYEAITPLLDSALAGVKAPLVKVLIDGTEFEGWEARAIWDDFKLGLKHGNEFIKVAIYGNIQWQEFAAKIGSWFIAGEVKYFENENDAILWLNES